MNIKIIIICAATLVPFRTFAQYSDTTSYSKKVQSALETKKAGATITILGALALATGMIAVNSNLDVGAAPSTRGHGRARRYHDRPSDMDSPQKVHSKSPEFDRASESDAKSIRSDLNLSVLM